MSFRLSKYYNWLIFHVINSELKPLFEKYAHGKMADIGCGTKPYKELLASHVDEHIGIDHQDTQHQQSEIDISASAYDIPLNNETFDFILCTDVLEHLEEPSKAIAEAYRLLKKNCYAIYSVPLFWHIHEAPRDFYRYTKYGLEYLFKKNGFQVVEIKVVSGFWITFSQEFCYYLLKFRKYGKVNPLWWIIPVVIHFVQIIGLLLNKIDKDENFATEYIAVVKKT